MIYLANDLDYVILKDSTPAKLRKRCYVFRSGRERIFDKDDKRCLLFVSMSIFLLIYMYMKESCKEMINIVPFLS